MYTLSPSFTELYLLMTKLCSVNQDNPNFSVFKHHAEVAVSKLSWVH